MKKLDPKLRLLVRDLRQREEARSGLEARVAETPERVQVLVEFRGDFEELRTLGLEAPTVVEHPAEGYKIAAGSIPVARLEELAALDHVTVVEGPRRLRPELNYSLTDIRAASLHGGATPSKGRGVVIGVIDSGIDFRHGSFIKADNRTSRILALWDQRLQPQAGETGPPSNPGIGVEYLQARINQALQGTATVRSRDTNEVGHGTHVAGIAAGDGSPATCCHGGSTFVGVAPEADLIVVRLASGQVLGNSTNLVHALNYVFNHPAAAGKPIVINISLGDNLGAHDGTSLVERTIDALVTAAAGRVVVKSAGNEGDTKRHVKSSVPGRGAPADPPGTLDVAFNVEEDDDEDEELELWYPGGTHLDIRVAAPDGTTSAPVAPGGNLDFTANPGADANRQTVVHIESDTNQPHNNDNRIRITLFGPANGALVHGEWQLKLSNPGAAAVEFHCWIDRGEKTPTFVNPTTDATISIPGTAREVIAVANFAGRTGCCDCCPSEDIEPSSSRGPVRKNAAANPKPDIAAPGKDITSAKADPKAGCCDCCPDWCCCMYHDLTGTSMAAPHVTGAVALLLERDPTLTKAQILQHLRASARAAPAPADPNVWGAGKLDAQAALGRLPAPAPVARGLVAAEAFAPSPPPRPTGVAAPPGTAAWLQELKRRALSTPEGQICAAVVSRHFSEVRRLINSERKVATLWHRGEGPGLLRRVMASALDAEAPAPVASAEQKEYLTRFLEFVRQHGSPRLAADVARYGPRVVGFLELPAAGILGAGGAPES